MLTKEQIEEWRKQIKDLNNLDPIEIQNIYDQNITQEEIGQIFNKHQRTISKFMRKHKLNIRIAKKRNQYGENNHMWKGEDITYKGAHNRVNLRRGKPNKCVKCGTTKGKFEWASINKNHHDPNDYQAMCIKCHRNFDLQKSGRQAYKETRNCLYCNKEFIVTKKYIKQKFCSTSCWAKNKIIIRNEKGQICSQKNS